MFTEREHLSRAVDVLDAQAVAPHQLHKQPATYAQTTCSLTSPDSRCVEGQPVKTWQKC